MLSNLQMSARQQRGRSRRRRGGGILVAQRASAPMRRVLRPFLQSSIDQTRHSVVVVGVRVSRVQSASKPTQPAPQEVSAAPAYSLRRGADEEDLLGVRQTQCACWDHPFR